MAVSKLGLYNAALTLVGERRLGDLYENREPRRVLDEIYSGGAIDYCLEISKPKFALRTRSLTGPSSSSVHGLDSVYTLPSDYVTVMEKGSFFADEDLENPVYRYLIEGRTVATDVSSTLYIRYICNSRGLTEWTPSFFRLVASYLARELASRINPPALEVNDTEFKQRLEAVVMLEGVKEVRPLPQQGSSTLSTDQLAIYNSALSLVGIPALRYGDDESPGRVAIDAVYEQSVAACLETIRPRFACKVEALDSPSTSPQHAYDQVHTLPDDYITMVNLYSDELLDEPVDRFFTEGNTLATEYSTVYLRFVSDEIPENLWTAVFKEVVAAYLADRVAPQLIEADPQVGEGGYPRKDTRGQDLKRILEILQMRMETALQTEQFKEPARRATPENTTLSEPWRRVYNAALEILGLPMILSTTDDSERRARLDFAVENRAVDYVLGKIGWTFAYKSVKLEANPSYEPEWGYKYAYDVPADMERIESFSADEYLRSDPDYTHESEFFFTDQEIIYVRYVSTEYLTDPSKWPTYFWNLVAGELARRCSSLPNADAENARYKYEEYRQEAMATDAMRNPPQVIGEGSWVSSRGFYGRGRRRRP